MSEPNDVGPDARAIFETHFPDHGHLVLSYVPVGGTRPTVSEGFLDWEALWVRHDDLVASGREVFIACASFTHDPRALTGQPGLNGQPERYGRKKANVHAIRALRGDVDCDPSGIKNGRPCFRNSDEADSELLRLGMAQGFPATTLVLKSGGGLHLWWRLDRDVSATEAAALLKNFCLAMESVDPRLVADPSRWADLNGLLRAPYSLNMKYDPPTGRPVMPHAYSEGDWNAEDVAAWSRGRIGPSAVPAPPPNGTTTAGRARTTLMPETINMDWVRKQVAALKANPAFAVAVQDRKARLDAIVFPLADAAAIAPEHRAELLTMALELSALGGEKFADHAPRRIEREFERAARRSARDA